MSKPSHQLLPGDVVEVRPWPEIHATLDENGTREGLTFMPEMLKHCGQQFVVNKWIAGNEPSPFGGPRHIRNVVLLSGLHCDGAAHSGCAKACVLCWKQEWLTKVGHAAPEGPATTAIIDAPTPTFPYKLADGRFACQYDEVAVAPRAVPQPKPTREELPYPIQRLSLDEFAAFQQTVGQKVVQVDGFWWRQVRPCFYRPLVPFREFTTTSTRRPASAWLGGVQYVVPCGQQANSTMSFLIFPDAGAYSLDTLRSKPRRQVRWAAERFTVRPLTARAEFKEHAYPVYKAFYARTKYKYLAERLHKTNFDKWTDAVFQHGPSLILGAFRGVELSAVSIAHAIEDTLIYSTVFGKDEALRDHVSSLLLHTVRLSATQDGNITQVYAGMPKPAEDRGIDEFLIRRGCCVVTKPAFIRLNLASKLVLRWLMSDQYARMRGDEVESVSPAEESSGSSSAE